MSPPFPDVTYVDQDPTDLHLCLVRGSFDPAGLTVLQQQSAVLGGLEVTAAIIGASHFVTFGAAHNDMRLTEVFACKRPDRFHIAYSLDALLTTPIRNHLELGRDHVPWDYLMRTTTSEEYSASPFGQHGVFRPGRDGTGEESIRLVQEFPAAPGSPPALTAVRVGFLWVTSAIVVETLHTYPTASQHKTVLTTTHMTSRGSERNAA